ncbi:MAG: TIGR00266 family protein, partial [Haloarculaceae archaeon]
MESDIRHGSAFALLDVTLDAGEAITAEAGAMVSMSPDVSVSTNANGGIMGSLKRSVLGGESFFVNTFTAESGGSVTLAPPLPGDVVEHDLDGTLYVQSGSYLAADPAIDVDTKFGGGRTFFG